MNKDKAKTAETKDKYSVPAVDGMLDIVEFLAKADCPCGVTELSRQLKLTNNLIFRIMKKMEARGYVVADSASAYQLGPAFFSLGMKLHARFDLRRQGRAFIEELCRKTGETCQIQIPDGDRMLVVDVVTPQKDYFLTVLPGSRTYYHGNAFGKCLMAYMPEDQLAKILSGELPKLTVNIETVPEKIKEELKSVRRTGLAYDREEYINGIYCVGAPVFNARGEAAAGVGMTGMANRQNRQSLKEIEKEVKLCAAGISRAIGFRTV
jgi:IclR family acetate operon transcriptional repressor